MSNINDSERFMLAGEFCSQNMVIVNKTESVVEAARLMKAQNVCKVLVMESVSGKNNPVCVLTNHDIVTAILALCVNINDVINNGIASKSIIVGEKDDLMLSVMRMKANNVRNIPVVDGMGGVVGILSMDDIFDSMIKKLIVTDQCIEQSEINKKYSLH